MLVAFVIFLIIEACFLVGACLYVSPMMAPGTRSTKAQPVTLAPLPRAIAIPALCRKRRWP